jgi:hypothetical protein
MASEVKTNKVSPSTGTTLSVGDAGDTLALATDAVTGFQVGSDAAGDILYHDGTDYTRRAKPGTPADEVLTFATGASAPTWVAPAAGGVNTPYFYAHLSADDTTPGDNAWTKVKCNTVAFETGTTYDETTNYRWTPAVAGKYYLYGQVECKSDTSYKLGTVIMAFYLNGVETIKISEHKNENTSWIRVPTMSAIIDLGATDYVELWANIDTYSGVRRFVGGSTQITHFMGYKLID